MTSNIGFPEDHPKLRFPLSSELPTELRSQIWEEAVFLAQPRVVFLEPKQLPTKGGAGSPARQQTRRWGFWSHCRLPLVLLVCRESFAVASRYYQRSSGTEHAQTVSVSVLYFFVFECSKNTLKDL
jgi:hypothetical protein